MSVDTGTLPKARLIDIQSHEDRVASSNRSQGFAEGLLAASNVVLPIQDDDNGRKIRRAILDLIKEDNAR